MEKLMDEYMSIWKQIQREKACSEKPQAEAIKALKTAENIICNFESGHRRRLGQMLTVEEIEYGEVNSQCYMIRRAEN